MFSKFLRSLEAYIVAKFNNKAGSFEARDAEQALNDLIDSRVNKILQLRDQLKQTPPRNTWNQAEFEAAMATRAARSENPLSEAPTNSSDDNTNNIEPSRDEVDETALESPSDVVRQPTKDYPGQTRDGRIIPPKQG